MEYVSTAQGLDLVRDGEALVSIPRDGEFAILFEPDDVIGGTILKHGEAERVRQHHRQTWAQLMRAEPVVDNRFLASVIGVPDRKEDVAAFLRDIATKMEIVTIPVSEMTEEVLEEINACLAISGRVGKLQERLAAMAPAPSPAP